MSTDDTYNGWTNRETWAVALHINNDQGWQESVHESLRELVSDDPSPEDSEAHMAYKAGDIVREQVEDFLERWVNTLTMDGAEDDGDAFRGVRDDIGSLWRVNWTELGASFLADISES